MTDKNTISTLHLVTTPRSFFNKQITSLENENIECDIISVPGKHQAFDETVKTRTYYDYLRFYPSVLKKSLGSYDLIHANHGLTAPFALAQPQLPVVVSLWGNETKGRFGHLIDICSRLSDAVILPSKSMDSLVNTDYTYIPFPVDSDIFKPISQSKAREKIGWRQNKNIALFPYPKSRSIKNYPLAEQIVEEIEGLELYNISNIPYEMVPIYMNASDCVLVTSKRESGPMVVKEAALCNVPVISTDVGFTSEFLSNIKNSYVCSSERELKEQLKSVIESGERSDGHKYADRLGLDRMGERLVDVYQSVLEEQ
jgi:glycosyltransferase involved in cell wall biosynthesis